MTQIDRSTTVVSTERITIVKYEWKTEDFNRATGNNCKDFKPNHFTNETI